MRNPRLALAVTALVAALPFITGCVPAVIATGATVGVMSAQDRRSTGVQTDDEGIEWKAAQSVPERYAAASHLNFTSFNQRLLITGEVPSEEARTAIGQQGAQVLGVREVFNETTVGPASSLSVRSNDSYLTSKVKARLVDSNQISANHIKVLTERGFLRRGIRYQVLDKSTVQVGTDSVYAATHQYGRDEANIPARPFLGLSSTDRREITAIIRDWASELGFK